MSHFRQAPAVYLPIYLPLDTANLVCNNPKHQRTGNPLKFIETQSRTLIEGAGFVKARMSCLCRLLCGNQAQSSYLSIRVFCFLL